MTYSIFLRLQQKTSFVIEQVVIVFIVIIIYTLHDLNQVI
jgi:hypothetical protein